MRAIDEFGVALARAYEPDADLRRDLLQEIDFALGRSFAGFTGQCSLRTWEFRVAHNVGISRRLRKRHPRLVSLEEIVGGNFDVSGGPSLDNAADDAQRVARLHDVVRRLVPPDSQVMLLYLEDLSAAAIGEITGLSAAAVFSDALADYVAPMLLMVAAHVVVLWQVWKRFTPRATSPQASAQSALQFHRAELEPQHGAVSRAWQWYIAPFMPAFVWELAIWGGTLSSGSAGDRSALLFAMVVGAAVGFWGCVWLAFSRHAVRLELELERLASVRAE